MLLKSYNSYVMKEMKKFSLLTIDVGLTLAKCLKVLSSLYHIKVLNPDVSIKGFERSRNLIFNNCLT